MIYTNLPRNCVVFVLLCKLTRSAIIIADRVCRRGKGKPLNFEANLCGSLYSTFTTSSNYMHLISNGYKRYRPTRPIQGNVFLQTLLNYEWPWGVITNYFSNNMDNQTPSSSFFLMIVYVFHCWSLMSLFAPKFSLCRSLK